YTHIGKGRSVGMGDAGGVKHIQDRAELAQIDIIADPIGPLVIPERCFHWLHISRWSKPSVHFMPRWTLVLLLFSPIAVALRQINSNKAKYKTRFCFIFVS